MTDNTDRICPWGCGRPYSHYMTHICEGCECWHTDVTIPGEPQMGSYFEAEPNPDCPVHGAAIRGEVPHD